jgi:putative transposase
MARLPRYFVHGLPLHVIQRGNDRSAIFRATEDLRFYRACLRDAGRAHRVAIHAYVLMTNHVHLLATPGDTNSLPRMMQSIGRVYVQYFNNRYCRTGTLWEGRYKAAIVDCEHYFLTCMRYIELNPVRASMVESPGDYCWSSYQCHAHGKFDDLIQAHPVYEELGRSTAAREAAYRELFGSPISSAALQTIRDATQHAWAIGEDKFRTQVTALSRRGERLQLGRPRKDKKQAANLHSDPTSHNQSRLIPFRKSRV